MREGPAPVSSKLLISNLSFNNPNGCVLTETHSLHRSSQGRKELLKSEAGLTSEWVRRPDKFVLLSVANIRILAKSTRMLNINAFGL